MPKIETRTGDRLDLLAATYLLDPMKWGEIVAVNPLLILTKGFYVPSGLLVEIPELLPEKNPDLLPWEKTGSNTDSIPTQIPIIIPPDIQPGSNPNELLSGSGWLTPAAVKILLAIPNYTFPLSLIEGGHGAVTAAGARANLGAVGFADIPASSPPGAIGVTVAPLGANLLVPSAFLPAYPTLTSLSAVSTSTYTAVLALKLDASARSAVNGIAPLGADGLVPFAFLPAYPTLTSLSAVSTSTYTAGLALKLDTSARSAVNGIAPLGADGLVPFAFLPAYPTLASLSAVSTSTYTAGLALKLDTSARNSANGVAGLDPNSLIPVGQIPLSLQFQLLARTASVAVDFNTVSANHGGVRYFDNNVVNPNAPAIGTNGTLLQFESLFGVSSNLWKAQTFIAHNGRRSDRSQNNGVWGGWSERAYLSGVQPFSTMQEFSTGARFRAGGIPAVTTTMTQAGVDASGNPRYWLVNATAATGNRLKSITISTNGNIQFRHHADDGTDGNVLEHTASGNVLTNGTVRCGGGTTHFTGASFVPGALYFRSDLGMLLFSDGTNWRRMDNNAIV